MSETKTISLASSFLFSLAAWLVVGGLTILLFSLGLFALPFTLLTNHGSGYYHHLISRWWALSISILVPLWEIEVEGLEQIEKNKPYVIVSNHQSFLDILVLLKEIPLHFKFIVKKDLFQVPIFGWHLFLARYIPLDRNKLRSWRICLEQARKWLRGGASVLFFPEGTRTTDGQIQEFKSGAFKLALEEKIDVLPVVIVGTRESLPKHSWRIRGQHVRSKIRLVVERPISAQDLSVECLESFKTKIRAEMVESFQRIKADKRVPA